MKKIIILAMAVLVSTSAFAGWDDATPRSSSGSDYGRGGAMVSGNAMEAVVVNVRAVKIEAGTMATTAGRTVGAGVGGIIGQTMGNGNGRLIAGVVGALAGGVLGDVAADAISTTVGQEIVARLKDGRLVVITQGGEEHFARGDNIYIISMNGNTRVTRA
jgi:outer membrane lipoprotein SlyB